MHQSVLLHEVIDLIAPKEGMIILDGTFGAGGHSKAIAERIGKAGTLIALDADESVFSDDKIKELECLTKFVHVTENFRHAAEVLKRLDLPLIDGVLLDLGLSSTQLESSGRGFSFQRDEPLAMTFCHSPGEDDVTAEVIVNQWSEASLRTILEGFGEERYARSIASAIVRARNVSRITRTGELVDLIRGATPKRYQFGRTHFATRTFQALRMAANDELGAIEAAITGISGMLRSGGRFAIISFHSIEDRVVKSRFRELVEVGGFERITKKPVIASQKELEANPRARSAKLRVIRKG